MTRHVVQHLRACLVAVFSYATIGFAGETTDEPAPACPAPKLEQTDWRPVEITGIGVRLKMPKRYTEKHWAVKVGNPNPTEATYQAGDLESFTLEVLTSADSLEQQKDAPQSDYQGYTECTEAINGHQAVIESFRGGGVIILGDLEFPPFAVHAVFKLAPSRTLWFHGSTATRAAQEDLLGIIRTIKFTR